MLRDTEAAMILNAASQIQVTGNQFRNIGSIAIDINNGSKNNTIMGNRITDIAGSGIQLGYFPTNHTDKPIIRLRIADIQQHDKQ